jgi:hypothetical protein
MNGIKHFVCAIAAGLVLASCSGNPQLPKRHALVYGVAEYDTYSSLSIDLYSTDEDALAMRDLLERKGYNVKTRISTNSDGIVGALPDRAQLVADLEAAAGELDDDDSFLLYFSGHGGRLSDFAGATSTDTSEPYGHQQYAEYIVLYNYLGSSLYSGTAIDANEFPKISMKDDDLAELIRKIPARSKTIIFDSCNSGGFIGSSPTLDPVDQQYDGSEETRGFESRRQALELYAAFPGSERADVTFRDAVVLAAGGAAEEVWETGLGGGHGVFTFLFTKGAEGGPADRNDDGHITVSEMYSYIHYFMDEYHNDRSHAPTDSSGRPLTDARWKYMPRLSGGAVDFVLFDAD